MDIRKLYDGAGATFNRIIQQAEEVFLDVPKTEYSEEYKNNIKKIEFLMVITERLISDVENFLEPKYTFNLDDRITDSITDSYEKLLQIEEFGFALRNSPPEIKKYSPLLYKDLLRVGKYQLKLGRAMKDYRQKESEKFYSNLKNMLEIDLVKFKELEISLENMRLDHDYAKNKMEKAFSPAGRDVLEKEYEKIRPIYEKHQSDVYNYFKTADHYFIKHRMFLKEFVEIQRNYYRECDKNLTNVIRKMYHDVYKISYNTPSINDSPEDKVSSSDVDEKIRRQHLEDLYKIKRLTENIKKQNELLASKIRSGGMLIKFCPDDSYKSQPTNVRTQPTITGISLISFTKTQKMNEPTFDSQAKSNESVETAPTVLPAERKMNGDILHKDVDFGGGWSTKMDGKDYTNEIFFDSDKIQMDLSTKQSLSMDDEIKINLDGNPPSMNPEETTQSKNLGVILESSNEQDSPDAMLNILKKDSLKTNVFLQADIEGEGSLPNEPPLSIDEKPFESFPPNLNLDSNVEMDVKCDTSVEDDLKLVEEPVSIPLTVNGENTDPTSFIDSNVEMDVKCDTSVEDKLKQIEEPVYIPLTVNVENTDPALSIDKNVEMDVKCDISVEDELKQIEEPVSIPLTVNVENTDPTLSMELNSEQDLKTSFLPVDNLSLNLSENLKTDVVLQSDIEGEGFLPNEPPMSIDEKPFESFQPNLNLDSNVEMDVKCDTSVEDDLKLVEEPVSIPLTINVEKTEPTLSINLSDKENSKTDVVLQGDIEGKGSLPNEPPMSIDEKPFESFQPNFNLDTNVEMDVKCDTSVEDDLKLVEEPVSIPLTVNVENTDPTSFTDTNVEMDIKCETSVEDELKQIEEPVNVESTDPTLSISVSDPETKVDLSGEEKVDVKVSGSTDSTLISASMDSSELLTNDQKPSDSSYEETDFKTSYSPKEHEKVYGSFISLQTTETFKKRKEEE